MRNPSKILLSLLALSAVVLTPGCTKKPAGGTGATDEAGGKRTVVIGFIGKSLSNDVFQAAEVGAKDAAKTLGEKYGVNVVVEVRTPNEEDATKQAEAIEALTRRGVQGIAVSCSESATVSPSIDAAVDGGVAVMCFDSDSPASKRFAYYGTDDKSCGERTVDELAKAMGEKGTIAILGGNQSAPNLQARVQGAKDALKKYPNMRLNEPGAFFHVETPEKSAEAVANAQNANPGIQGWAFIGGWPLFTADALKWAPGSIKVVSVDALPAQLDYLKTGHVEVLLAQDCYGWGSKSVEMLLDKILNNKTPENPIVVDSLTRVSKENVESFGGNWDKWLKK